jgi:hypothetical protein
MAVSVWKSRQNLFVDPGLQARSKVTGEWVNLSVIAALAARAIDPLNKMEVVRPNDKNSEGLRIIEKCGATILGLISQPSPTISPPSTAQEPALAESVNTISFK